MKQPCGMNYGIAGLVLGWLLASTTPAQGAGTAPGQGAEPGNGQALEPHKPFEFRREGVLGTSMQLVVSATEETHAALVLDRVLAEIERLEACVSTYRTDSELAALIAGAGTRAEVSMELFDLLERAAHWFHATNGAFHPGVGALTTLWREAETAGTPPTSDALRAACAPLADLPWSVNGHSVTVDQPAITLDGLAKGWILDRALTSGDTVGGSDAHIAWLDIGGDVLVGETQPHRVRVADPQSTADNGAPLCEIQLRGRAIASSAGHLRGFDIGGAHYSHILDPRTGQPAQRVIGVSVVAPSAADADALATSCAILTPEEGLALIGTLPDTECLVVDRDGQTHRSPGWAAMEVSATADAPLDHWPSNLAFAIEFELRDPNAGENGGDDPAPRRGRGRRGRGRGRGGYKRPYVAVWIENDEGTPVRTLTLWVERLKWLPDLRRWSRHHRRDSDLIKAVTQATRKAGTYELAWDGTDNDGQAVPAGDYTVFLEVSREHGTYQLMRQPIQLNGSAFVHALDGNVEVGSATVRFAPPSKPGADETKGR